MVTSDDDQVFSSEIDGYTSGGFEWETKETSMMRDVPLNGSATMKLLSDDIKTLH